MQAPTLTGLAAAFALMFVVFRALELRLPRDRRTPLRRKGLLTDLSYWIFTPFVAHYVVGLIVVIAVAVFALIVYGRVEEAQIMGGFGPLSKLAFWQQSLLMLILADFIGYWTHRLFHGRRLWRFHAIHHSSQTLDWLSSVRAHPVNDLVSRMATTVPLLGLGFAPAAAAWVAPVFAIFAILLHANLDWDWGPLRSVVASPRFHRWHHTSEAEGRDKNFAGLFPVWDILFGTYHMPRDRRPERFGTQTPVPEGLFAQLAFPFRSGEPSAEPRHPPQRQVDPAATGHQVRRAGPDAVDAVIGEA
jgi:sterol desaturase/sphingolipid hydroxylase (fatty acid hydroxylase superfamily)